MSKTALGTSAADSGTDKDTSAAPTASSVNAINNDPATPSSLQVINNDPATPSSFQVINNGSATPTIVPLPTAQKRLGDVKVDRYTINGILVPDEAGQMRIQTSIHPRPKNAKEAHHAVDALCAKLFEVNFELSKRDLALGSFIAENHRLKDEQCRLLWEKDQLNQVVSILKNQLEDLQLKHKDLSQKFEHINTKYELVTSNLQSELKQTKENYESVSETLATTVKELKDTQSTVEKLQRMQVFAGVGSWIEFARSQILKELGTDGLTTQNQAQKWHELCQKSKQDPNFRDLVNTTIKKLFGLEPYEWIIVSVDFYKNARNPVVHERPSVSEALELVDLLPRPFDSRKNVFKTLIKNAATMEPECNDDCF